MNLDYNPAVSARLIKELERRVRPLGLSLDTLELLGQDTRVALAFIRSAQRGEASDYLARVDMDALRRILRDRTAGRYAPEASKLGVGSATG